MTVDTAPLRRVIGLDQPLGWMMAPSERLALLGLLSLLRPREVLELGCADGGLTRHLGLFAERVVTVDIDEKVLRVTRDLPNVEALCMTTEEATRRLVAAGRRFDLTVIDADHSEEGVRRDLENSLGLSEILLLHDTYHPACRAGIERALAAHDVYRDLDLVPGGLQPDGLWGGLGIVIPSLPRNMPIFGTARQSIRPEAQTAGRLRRYADRAIGLLRRG